MQVYFKVLQKELSVKIKILGIIGGQLYESSGIYKAFRFD